MVCPIVEHSSETFFSPTDIGDIFRTRKIFAKMSSIFDFSAHGLSANMQRDWPVKYDIFREGLLNIDHRSSRAVRTFRILVLQTSIEPFSFTVDYTIIY